MNIGLKTIFKGKGGAEAGSQSGNGEKKTTCTNRMSSELMAIQRGEIVNPDILATRLQDLKNAWENPNHPPSFTTIANLISAGNYSRAHTSLREMEEDCGINPFQDKSKRTKLQ